MIAVVTILARLPARLLPAQPARRQHGVRHRLPVGVRLPDALPAARRHQREQRTRPSSRRVPAVLRRRHAARSSWSASGWCSSATASAAAAGAASGELALVADRHHRQRGEREHRRQRERRAGSRARSRPARPAAAPRPRSRNWAVFCTPRARPDQNGPARSATAVNASPLSATVTTVATTTRGTATAGPSPAVAPEQQHRRGRRDRHPAQRPHPAADHVGELAGARSGRARRPPGRRRPGRRPRPATSAGPGPARPARRSTPRTAGPPAAPRPRGSGAGSGRRGRGSVRRSARPPAAAGRAPPARRGRAASPQAATGTHTAAYGPWPVGDDGHRRGGDAHADRLGHLPDAHREAPAPGREPADDHPAAGDVAAGRGERRPARGRARAAPPSRTAPRATPSDGRAHQPGQQHQPLAAAVGHDAPRHQRQHHADHRGRRDQAGLGQGQPLALVQRRDQERRPVHHHRGRRLGHGARREHRPAPANADLGGPVDGGGHPTIERPRDSSARCRDSRRDGP